MWNLWLLCSLAVCVSQALFCPKNHLLSSSKSMESPDAGVEVVIKAVDKYQVFYTTMMVCDDDSTLRAKCKWSYKDLQLQNPLFEWRTNNSSSKKANHSGCFPLHVKEPVFSLIPHTEFASYFAPVSWCLEAQNAMQDWPKTTACDWKSTMDASLKKWT